jgi:uncharacterized protein (TIGR02391 family)
MASQVNRLDELNSFRSELLEFSTLVGRHVGRQRLTEKQKNRISELYDIISEKVGYLGTLISELSHISTVDVRGKDYDMWRIGLKTPLDSLSDSALGVCLQATNRAIGKLADDIRLGIRDEQGNPIEKLPLVGTQAAQKDIPEVANALFDKMRFHPKVVEASRPLFKDGYYAQAIFEAFKAVNNFVKEKAVLSLDGKALMSKVFSEDAPIIKLNELLTQSDKDEQEGFKFLFMGAMVGIRNPKAHDSVIQKDPFITLEYLGFASFLIKRIDYWEAEQNKSV